MQLEQFNFLLFFHLAGIVVGLGAVTVIDMMGFVSRKSKSWTQTTIQAHHVTKPLIWLGTSIILVTLIIMNYVYPVEGILLFKNVLMGIMIVNGSFLSFYVSPRLDKLKGKNVLLPSGLQTKIAISMIISFMSWWLFVILTVLQLS